MEDFLLLQREARGKPRSALGSAADGDRPSQGLDTSAQPCQSEPAALEDSAGIDRAIAAVADLDSQNAVLDRREDLLAFPAGVAPSVVQAFLGEAIQADVERGINAAGQGVDIQANGRAGASRMV